VREVLRVQLDLSATQALWEQQDRIVLVAQKFDSESNEQHDKPEDVQVS